MLALRITVVIPTYNEAENLPSLVTALLALPLDLTLHIVDDASPDGTGDIADALCEKHPGRIAVVHRPGKLGLRSAYVEGFRAALADGAEAVGQMDADFSHDPARLVAMAEALETHDVVLGSRYVEGGSLDPRWPVWRKGLSAWGNFYARSILSLPLRDVTTGFRLWRREALERMPLDDIQSSGYVFLVEMAYVAYRLGHRFAQVPIHFSDRRWGKSKMSLRIQLEAAARVWQVRWAYRGLLSAVAALTLLSGCVDATHASPAPIVTVAPETETDIAVLHNNTAIHAHGGRLVALRDGDTAWELVLPNSDLIVAPLAVALNSVTYVRGARALHAAGPDGKWLWSKPLEGRSFLKSRAADSPVALTDSSVALVINDDVVRFDLDGGIRWRVTLPDGHVVRRPAAGTDGSIILATTVGLVAVSAEGEIAWRRVISP
jgi:dolichol-phosphate mannosyltransferase